MLQLDNQYTRLRWVLTIVGLFLYVVDICTDVGLALKYFQEGHFLWTGLTLLFVLAGLLATQVFSFAWYRDDMNGTPEEKTLISGTGGLAAVHVFGMGIFIRYFHLLKDGFKVVWTKTQSNTMEERRLVHQNLFSLAADLSMLKLFETFLESAPQLLLQLYIALDDTECTVLQYLSMAFSFFNIAWALVDYRRCLRRSLPHITEMPSGTPTVIYLLYKICTITSLILSYTLLLMLSPYTAVALSIVWGVGTIWTHVIETDFCSSTGLEFLYRGIIGVILMFTFFNVKGQDTRVEMTIYYFFYSVINVMSPLLLTFLGPELYSTTFLLTVSGLTFGLSVLGLVCLVLYYVLLHPREKWREADEVDGLGNETKTTVRMKKFLQLG